MTEERKCFVVETQKVKDVLTAIEVIEPVISTIREWGSADRELLKVKTEINKLQKEVKAIDAVLAIFPNSSITKVLKEEREQRVQQHNNLEQRKTQLEQISANLLEEILKYQEYVKVFAWINENILKFLFERISADESMDFYATIFFVDNCYQHRRKLLEVFNEYFPDRKGLSKALNENKFLRYLRSH